MITLAYAAPMRPRLSSAVLVVAALWSLLPPVAAAQEPTPRPNFSELSSHRRRHASRERPSSRSVSTATGQASSASRPSILMTSLYATTAIMQGLDVHSTMKAH